MLSLRALEENDRVAKRISKRGCKSGGVILTLGRSTRALVCRAPCPLFALAISPCFIARAIKITRLGWPTTFRALLPSFDPRYVSYVQICIYCIMYLYIYIYIGTMWKIFGYVTSVFILVRHGTRPRYIGKHAV